MHIQPNFVEAGDRIGDRDRLFFERHKHRKHLLRRVYSGEIALTWPQLPIALVWFAVVHRVGSGIRVREFIIGPRFAETDLSDDAIMALLSYIDSQRGEDRNKFRRGVV
jgi:hypothetical protein